jgi:mannose-6-phosphate isomerase-like protein (cupin superfamily)
MATTRASTQHDKTPKSRTPKALPAFPVARAKKAPSMTEAIVLGDFIVEPLSSLPEQTHDMDEIYYFLEGEGEVVVGGQSHRIKPGACVTIPAGVPHYTSNHGLNPVRFLYILSKKGIVTHLSENRSAPDSGNLPS